MRELKFMRAKPVATSTCFLVVLNTYTNGVLVETKSLCKQSFKYIGSANSYARFKKKEISGASLKLNGTTPIPDPNKSGLEIAVIPESKLKEVTQPNTSMS